MRGNRNERLPGLTSFGDESREKKTLESEIMRFALEATGAMTDEIPASERRRLFVAVASACGGFGNPDEDTGEWELDVDQVRAEIATADAFAEAWRAALDAFDTTLAQDEAALTAARAGSARRRIVAAIEYRAESGASRRACGAARRRWSRRTRKRRRRRRRIRGERFGNFFFV